MADSIKDIQQLVGLLQQTTTGPIPDYVAPLDTAVLKSPPALPPIDYTNLDFSSIKLQLVNLLKANASLFGQDITDFSDANTTGMLLNVISYMGQMLSYHTDSMVNELFLDTAQSNWAVSKLLSAYGYKMSRPQSGVILLSLVRNASTNINATAAAQEDSNPIVVSTTTSRYNFTVNGERYELFGSKEIDGVLQPDLTSDFIIPAYIAPNAQGVDPTADAVLRNTYFCFALSGTTVIERFRSNGQPNQIIPLSKGPVNDSAITVKVDTDVWDEVSTLALASIKDATVVNTTAGGRVPFLVSSLTCSPALLQEVGSYSTGVGIPVVVNYDNICEPASYAVFASLHVPYTVGILASTPTSVNPVADVLMYHPGYIWKSLSTIAQSSYEETKIISSEANSAAIGWEPGDILYLTRQRLYVDLPDVEGISKYQPIFVSERQMLHARPEYTDLIVLRDNPQLRVAVGRAKSDTAIAFGISADVSTYVESDKAYELSFDGDFVGKVRFGDGIFGSIPSKNSVIEVQYRTNDITTTGRTVRAGDMSKTLRVNNVSLYLTNKYDGAPSTLGETPDIARQMAQRFFAIQERIVSGQDYVIMSKKFNPLIKATATLSDEPGEANIVRVYTVIQRNTVPVSITALTLTEKLKLRQFLSKFACLGVSIEIIDGVTRPLDIRFDIRIKPGFVASQVKADLDKAVQEYFSPANLELGAGLRANFADILAGSVAGIASIDAYLADVTYSASGVIRNQKTYYPAQSILGYAANTQTTFPALSTGSVTPDIFKQMLPHEILTLTSITINTLG